MYCTHVNQMYVQYGYIFPFNVEWTVSTTHPTHIYASSRYIHTTYGYAGLPYINTAHGGLPIGQGLLLLPYIKLVTIIPCMSKFTASSGVKGMFSYKKCKREASHAFSDAYDSDEWLPRLWEPPKTRRIGCQVISYALQHILQHIHMTRIP